MFVMTTHRCFVGVEAGRLVQLTDFKDSRVVQLDTIVYDAPISEGPLRGCIIASTEQGVSIQRGGAFASAAPGQAPIEFSRPIVQGWETFLLVPERDIDLFSQDALSPEAEMNRFARRVEFLIERGEPVKLYCGAGTVPRPGFLNLDIDVNSPRFLLERRDEYFIFPFVDQPLPIANNCVDYIFSEDFVEHITQIMQWQFLAEALRVMKPGAYNRVNTPSLLASMKRHSKFEAGFAGIYTGEAQWDHIAILTHFQLSEMATTIGYRDVVFTTRDGGVSPYAVRDFRPDADRADINGNIYADLLK